MSSQLSPKRRVALTTANVIGTLGYLSLLLQWAWTLLLVCYPFLFTNHSFLLPDTPVQPAHGASSPIATSPLMIGVAIIATAFVLVLTIIVIARLPKQIGRRGAKLTHQTADVVVPIVTQHKPLSKKKARVVSYRVILIAKAILILLPVIGLIWSQPTYPLTSAIIWTIGIYCACWSFFYFAVQQIIGIFANIDARQLW